jgi:hypothetical protein
MRELGLTLAQVDGFGGSAFRKLSNGRYAARAYDRLLRIVMVVSEDGLRESQRSTRVRRAKRVSIRLQSTASFRLAIPQPWHSSRASTSLMRTENEWHC